VSDLEDKGYEPLAFRYMCLNAHYRSKLNFTWDGIEAAQKSLVRLSDLTLAHKQSKEDVPDELISNLKKEFTDALSDDLNIPLAMGTVWNAARNSTKSHKIYELLMDFDKVIALNLDQKREAEPEQLPDDIQELANKRQQARKAKDWKKSDELRDQLNNAGYLVNDTTSGQIIKKA
jgi:cysteinyl-tRNA synthetase